MEDRGLIVGTWKDVGNGRRRTPHAKKPSFSPFFLARRMSPWTCFVSAPISLQNDLMT